VQNSDFGLLTSRDLEPVFWTPERLGRVSAWWGHVPFAFWLIDKCEPRLFVELGTHDTWAGDPHAGAYGEDVCMSN